jgi:hypothetical protein
MRFPFQVLFAHASPAGFSGRLRRHVAPTDLAQLQQLFLTH